MRSPRCAGSRSSSNEQLAIATGCSLLVARCSMSVPEGSEHASETEGHHIAMEIADVRKRLVQTIERAKRQAAERRIRTDQAARAFDIFLSTIAVPLFKQVAN